MNTLQHLHAHFHTEFDVLTREQKRLVLDDFAEMLKDEYDTPDPTMSLDVEIENIQTAAKEYARRIGRDNLGSYARCLAIGAKRKAEG